MHQSGKRYDEKATQKLIHIIETRDETVGSNHFDKEETAQALRTLIKQNANPNALNSKGRNTLWLVTILRNKPLLQSLLHRGICVNQEDNKGEIPLNFAISQMVVEFLKILIAAGANVNHQSNSALCLGQTPLMKVFHLGWKIRLTMVDMLLRADANVFLKDRNGQTVLHFAVGQGDLNMTQRFFSFNYCGLLLKDIPDNNRFTPLYLARNKPQVLAFLQQANHKIK